MKERRKYSRKKGASVVTPEVVEQICRSLTLGVPLRYACFVAGIDQTTFDRARRNSEELAGRIEAAEGTLMRNLTGQILLTAQGGTWQAAAWLLERRFPNFFAQVQRQEVSGPAGAPLAIAPASQDQYVRAVRKALGFNDDKTKPPCADRIRSVQVLRPDKPAAWQGANVVFAATMPVGNGARALVEKESQTPEGEIDDQGCRRETAGDGQDARSSCPNPLEEPSGNVEKSRYHNDDGRDGDAAQAGSGKIRRPQLS